jgi:hypothetical protein
MPYPHPSPTAQKVTKGIPIPQHFVTIITHHITHLNGRKTAMSLQLDLPERTQLHQWIDKLPPHQFHLVYLIVAEFVNHEQDETAYLLSSSVMRERLLSAQTNEDADIPLEVVRERLGI